LSIHIRVLIKIVLLVCRFANLHNLTVLSFAGHSFVCVTCI
jgi:hypothetical protein